MKIFTLAQRRQRAAGTAWGVGMARAAGTARGVGMARAALAAGTARAAGTVTLGVAAAVVAAVLAGCSSSSSSTPNSGTPGAAPSSAAAGSGGGGSTVSTSQCGSKPGTPATGTPIALGSIVTDQPGTSFTDIANMANAYFACVNANGGVNGHPIKYYIATEQTNPAQIAADARQLVQSDHVVGIIGNTSIIECSIDSSYWAHLGYYVIDSGIAPECYSTANSAAVNMGPRYSSDGAVQYALSQHVSKVVFDQSNVPGTGYIAAGPAALAAAAHVPIVQLTETVPIADANSVAIKEVDDAGPNGAVVLNFTPPEALVILQAAQKLGLEDRVKLWGCSTPCNTDFLAQSLGPKWNSKLFVNAELTPPDSTNTAAMNLYKAILAQYGKAVQGGIGSFSQMGFTEAEIAVHALESVKGAYTTSSVNAAFKSVTDFNTGMLCQLWTYGSYPMHIPNNMDYTVTPQNGKMTTAQGCTQISSVDPQIAAYRKAAGTAALAPAP
ncbi:MAG: ABC transporter substrate-binding protein [Streptosporangiaceae bacterium]|nr:ABC transporter substrate-binding protein [Streptosporangiaceae bacterium]